MVITLSNLRPLKANPIIRLDKARWSLVNTQELHSFRNQSTRSTLAKHALILLSRSKLLYQSHLRLKTAPNQPVLETNLPSRTSIWAHHPTKTPWWLLHRQMFKPLTKILALRTLSQLVTKRQMLCNLEVRCVLQTLKWDQSCLSITATGCPNSTRIKIKALGLSVWLKTQAILSRVQCAPLIQLSLFLQASTSPRDTVRLKQSIRSSPTGFSHQLPLNDEIKIAI